MKTKPAAETRQARWEKAPVRELGEVQLGRQRSPVHHSGKHMRPYLRVANVYEDRIDTSDVLEMNFTPEEFANYALKHGDILLNEGQSLELVGRPAMYRDEVPGACFQNTLLRYRVGPALDARFALLQFRWFFHSQRFQKIASWTTSIAHLGAKRFAEMELSIPPIDEQRRIVDEIEKQFTRLDAAVVALERVKASLKRYRASVLKAACEGRLVPTEAELARREGRSFESGEELMRRTLGPRDTGGASAAVSGWMTAALADLCSVFVDCAHRTPTYSDEGVPALRPRDVVGGRLRLEQTARVSTSEYVKQTARRRPEPGDIIYSRELSFGWAVEVPASPPVCMSQGMVLFRPGECIDQKFVVIVLNGPLGRRQAEIAATGSAHPHINLTDIRSYVIPLPPLAEQHRIIAEVERRLSVVDELEATVEMNLARCARLRQSILKMAFEGRLVPQDPKDEPASALLERIRRERETPAAGTATLRQRRSATTRKAKGA